MYKRIFLLALVLAASFGLPQGRPEVDANTRVRWGYYTGYDKATSLPSLRDHVADLTHVSPWYGYYIDTAGKLIGVDDPEVTNLIRSSGAKVVPLIQNRARYDDFHKQISNPTTRAGMVRAISDMVVARGYAGVNIDFEGISPSDRPHLTSFMSELYKDMRPRRKLVTMAVAAKTRDITTGWSGPYDYAALAPYADLFVIMAYDRHYPGGDPGAVAPIDWVRDCALFARSQFGANKLVVGLPFYGYDWNVTTGADAVSVKYPKIAELKAAYNATVSYDSATESGKATYTRNGERHEVWFDNARSFDAKLSLVRSLDTAGVAVWRMGQEDPRVWNSMRGLSIGLSSPAFSPNSDRYEDSLTVSYRTDSQSVVGLEVRDAAGKIVRTLQAPAATAPGVHALPWDGKDGAGARLPDGRYTVRVMSTIGGGPVSDSAGVLLNTVLRGLAVSPGTTSPAKDSVTARYSLDGVAKVRVVVTQDKRTVRTLLGSTTQSAGVYSFVWNGQDSAGIPAPEGGYSITAVAETGAGQIKMIRDFYLDRRAPQITNVRLANDRFYANGATGQVWSFYLSEGASVELGLLKGGENVRTISLKGRMGRNSMRWDGFAGSSLAVAGAYTYSLVATDAAGNKSAIATGGFTLTR